MTTETLQLLAFIGGVISILLAIISDKPLVLTQTIFFFLIYQGIKNDTYQEKIEDLEQQVWKQDSVLLSLEARTDSLYLTERK